MNTQPKDFIRVEHEQLQQFVGEIARATGLPDDKAKLLASLLTGNDLRGVISHGSQQIAAYAVLMRDGILNSKPDIRVVKESACSVQVDGDGGLGYFPSYEATERVIEKATASGIAVGMTQNHGHFGAAGLYARMPLEHDLLTFVTSGHQLDLHSGDPIYKGAGGSPMAFSIPCLREDHFVLDFGAMHDLYASDPHRDDVAKLTPGLILRSIGLGEVCQAWGGLLSGLGIDPEKRPWKYAGAGQGALFMCFRIDLFRDTVRFKEEMDEYVRKTDGLLPFPGLDEVYMPGGIEAARQREYLKKGIPLGRPQQDRLTTVAQEFSVTPPWQK